MALLRRKDLVALDMVRHGDVFFYIHLFLCENFGIWLLLPIKHILTYTREELVELITFMGNNNFKKKILKLAPYCN